MVGDRIDNDIIPAKKLGFSTRNLGPGTFFTLSFFVEICDEFFLIFQYFNDRIIMLNYFLEQ